MQIEKALVKDHLRMSKYPENHNFASIYPSI